MPETTTVNPQITDAAAPTQAEQTLQEGQIFVKILELENLAYQQQLDGAMKMVTDAMQQLISLYKSASEVSDARLDPDTLQQILQHLKSLIPAVPAAKELEAKIPFLATEDPKPAEPPKSVEFQQAVEMSYLNAVVAQQQMYIVQQTAFVTSYTTIVSFVAATLAKKSGAVNP